MSERHPSEDAEQLVALLDGELEAGSAAILAERLPDDADLRARLATLDRGGEGVRPAFDLLLDDAPIARLDAMLDGAIAATQKPSPAAPARSRPAWGWLSGLLAPAAAALAAGLVGLWLGVAVLGGPAHEEEGGWLAAVASYWALTTPDTLAIAPTPDHLAKGLALASDRLGITLSPAAIALPDADFRGATVFDYDGKPLVQLAYLDADGTPFAYCVIRAAESGAVQPTAGTMGGFNVVHWSAGDGVERMLIGRVPGAVLERYAALLSERAG
ncbi:anti-sigma factor RsiW [Kaistia hirudinis]|uniref:Anti-sigma factor RsiW n=1 Tax=Kaistia hirudinis TaxID=1293440 RepID=A0A840AK89_9HYPH|nr:hypothetical protein [Kaistia hirudinis]MBB3929574.1 anti-sigma factor RsiW [Kaistia hirudinis]